MSTAPGASAPLADWLDYIDQLHPREIDLGLERVRTVAGKLLPDPVAPLVITVAGTNGKGSCVHGVARALSHSGFRVGVYTSPHVEQFNERIVVAGNPVEDRLICTALDRVEASRGSVSLSYFEFATLAAFDIFVDAGLDAVVLEVGLGGRLDAVNLLDADISLLTSISLDHMNWLGPDRDTIGKEKVAIARTGRPLVCGDRDLPATVSRYGKQIGARLFRLGNEFDIQPTGVGGAWSWRGLNADGKPITVEALKPQTQIPDNLATVLQTLALLRLPFDESLLRELTALQIPGRFEWRRDSSLDTRVLLDVAHNPASAECLATRLAALATMPRPLVAVLAIMADKDIESMVAALQTQVDIWYIAQVDEERCMPVQELAKRLAQSDSARVIEQFTDAQVAYKAACQTAGADGLVLVTGSFHTVGAVRPLTRQAAA